MECPHLTDIASRTTSRVMHRSHLLSPAQVFNSSPPGYDFNQPTGTFEWEVFSKHEEWVGLYFTELQRLNPALAAVYSKEMFYEDWKIGCLQFLVGCCRSRRGRSRTRRTTAWPTCGCTR
eukprot:COSAG01_NODE_3012_length_6723_cov_13.578351_7_plen_120_part_00